MLILREEYYDNKGELIKVFESEEIADIDGFPTAITRKMTTPKKNNVTEIHFSDVHYNVGIDAKVFSERYLKSPPREYIKN
jgi:hypothetical protein